MVQIGEYVLDEDQVFHDASFECAAWSQDVKVLAGIYPVMAEVSSEDGRVTDFPGCSISLPGTIVADDFSPHFGGNAFSSSVNKRLGEAAKYSIMRYAHEVSSHILAGTEKRIKLFSQYEARVVDFEFDGKKLQSHGIFRL